MNELDSDRPAVLSEKYRPGSPVILFRTNAKSIPKKIGRGIVVRRNANGTFEINVPGATLGQPQKFPQVLAQLHHLPDHPKPNEIYAVPAEAFPVSAGLPVEPPTFL